MANADPSAEPTGRRSLRLLANALVLGVLLTPGVALGLWSVLTRSDLSELEPAPTPVLVHPTTRTLTGERNVVVVVRLGQAIEARSPGLAGIVTALPAKVGAHLGTGDPVLSVDGVTRLAVVTRSPFYRELTLGDKGVDVTELQRLLTLGGWLNVKPDGVYGSATRSAVKDFELAMGRAQPTGVFLPSSVIWLPSPIDVGRVFVAVGETLSNDAPLLEGSAPIVSASLVDGNGQPITALDGTFNLVIGGSDVGEVDQPANLDHSLYPALQEALTSAETAGDAGADDHTGQIPAVIRLATAREATVVPAGAVSTDATGSTECIFVEADGDPRAVPVTVTGGTLGVVELAERLPEETTVLANPTEILDDPSCPST